MTLRFALQRSEALKRYIANLDDIRQLLGIHANVGGEKPGRRKLDVLNKAGIVLVCAFWEAYCEDLAEEALAHLVKHTQGPDSLPLPLKKLVARDLKLDKNELAAWKLAGDGWKTILSERAGVMKEQRDRGLNTPKSEQIQDLFSQTIGIPDVTDGWHWEKASRVMARKRLDDFVTLRGNIAHRGGPTARPVWKKDVYQFAMLVTRLVLVTDESVNAFLESQTGVRFWRDS